MRIAFLGTPDFAVATLAELAAAGHDIAAVYTRAPRPAGRGQKEQVSPVHGLAERLGLTVRTPTSLKGAGEAESFAALGLDAALVVAYGLILPPAILAAPRLGCINVHASLLPRWRGAAPIQRAILAGDEETGITIMAMDEGLDTGAMLLAERVPIGPRASAGELHDRLAALGASLAVRALAALERGALERVPQPAEGITYAAKIDKAEARIDFSQGAAAIDRQVRALAPFPGAWFMLAADGREMRVKLLAAEPARRPSGPPGRLEAGTVACGEGGLRLLRLQREGRGAMAAEEFFRGLPPGADLALS